MSSSLLRVAVILAGILLAAEARAQEPGYALIIGFNGSPPSAGGSAPPPLRFADDDAMAFFELKRELGDRAVVLAAPDPDTRRRYPHTADLAQAPTLEAVGQAMARFEEEMRADVRNGRTPSFLFFYSGHGVLGADGQVALTLSDGMLTQRLLYEGVLDHVPAGVITHLVVDACHAEALARPRDGNAEVVTLSPADIAAYVSQSLPARYHLVGMAIASGRDGNAHEWDAYQSGVFTHEVISALRGAADINGDQRVEYSELGAFLAAANREVRDPRARLQAIVRAPVSAPRSPLADLSRARGTSRLTRIPAAPEAFSIEDSWGNRLVDGRPELGFAMSVVLPANLGLFVRRGNQEAELTLHPGVDAEFRSLAFRDRPLQARGAVESSLRAGLFLAQFGPAYYRGYVDRQEDIIAVPVAPDLGLLAEPPTDVPRTKHWSVARSSLVGAAAALLGSSVFFGGMSYGAWRESQGAVERQATTAANRFQLDTALTAGFLLSGVACLAATWLVGRETNP